MYFNSLFFPIEYIEDNTEGNTLLNLLISNYNKWYKAFPFDLDFFKALKEKYQNKIPLFKSGRLNKYSGKIVYTQNTIENLTEFLKNTILELLSEFNSLTWFEQGKLTDAEKTKLDIIVAERKLNLSLLGNTKNSTKTDYIKMLKSWYKQEKDFITEITPLLKNNITRENNLQRPNRTDIAYYCYYTSQTNTLITNNIFPSDKAWNELGEKFGKNSKNIQHAYNSICNNRDERLKSTKIKIIEYVITNMLADKKTAQKLAADELKLAKLNS